MIDGVGGPSRGFAALSALSLVAWRALATVGGDVRARLALATLGFVFGMVFSKAYLLLPSYRGRTLSDPLPVWIHLALAGGGTVAVAGAGLGVLPHAAAALGSVAWAIGVGVAGVVLGPIVVAGVLDVVAGGAAADPRFDADRVADAAVLVPGALLVVGAASVPTAFGGLVGVLTPVAYRPAAVHLLLVGTATALVFALGGRLLPRFFGGDPSPATVGGTVLAAGVGAASLAAGLPSGHAVAAGGALVSLAMGVYAVVVARAVAAGERHRVSRGGVAAGAALGVAAVVVGLHMAAGGVEPELRTAHRTLALDGFLTVTIVGYATAFYPPGSGDLPGASTRIGGVVVGGLVVGAALDAAGVLFASALVTGVGHVVGLFGAVGWAYLLLSTLQAARR